ncbi:amidohydrolase family protein [Cellulomonas sp. NS3]|uniref:amidohydrolase family protein n=1 Tax=Cellulomonas sp. NS3 TaxID=2973977 RepID=UPI0021614849|nr:amidohydrolase family protein [Cellulomonas sp. NS3]
MTPWHLRATVLPDGDLRDLWFEEDRISFTPIPGARTLHEGGFVVPGLVDTHTHPGIAAIGDPLDDHQLRVDAAAHLRSGTALIRVPGSASRLPAWFGAQPDHPRVVEAGLPVAVEGRFFPGWGRQVPVADVPRAAAEEAARAGWCKLIVDWFTDDGGYGPAMPAEVVAAATAAAHRAGGRVAVHTQSAAGGRSAVRAGVDSIEHGMHLPLDLLEQMATAGIALVPTATTFLALRPQMSGDGVPAAMREWFTSGVDRHAELVAAAVAAGVTVLAGTDLPPGSLSEEIHWLADAGMSTSQALAAGSWQARQWLGLPGVEDGAPADLLVLSGDPRDDLTLLDHAEHVVVRGRLVR